ncbi:Gfo/Idh/MocA family oxidoreductase [Stieleria sp. ICT_E10.1]|uniref:Gfo/Idh/MocA family protein n=1 Tax=Stieleria sedimenti TaxID=2976331 RepID=UPI0021805590|nr:Gfo/Idh/MocA family oxidoreductase [Stieleria sedimenti]MCS7469629.1 Gfo/Idh/MocA family oxidoreductase [Stieleria sedimenti]
MTVRPKDSTRRSFLKSTGLVALPTIVASTALGKDGRAPANERISIGMIGTGKMCHGYHLNSLLGYDDVQITAICEVDKNRRQSAKRKIEQKYGTKSGRKGCDEYTDFRDVIARDDIDAVLIATPDHWHAIPIIEACKAGKDVYCEKPLTLTILEAQRCIEAARKHDCIVQTGSQQRSSVFGPFRKACEFIRSGRIGKIKAVTVGVGKPSTWCDLPAEDPEPGLDWNMWLGQAPDRPYHSVLSARGGVSKNWPQWRAYREYSGGGHTDMGAHHYDIAQWALGMDESGPVQIIPPEDPSAGTGVRYIYANGVEMTHGGPSGCTFTGTEGTLRIDRGHLSADPADAIREKLADDEVHLYESNDHHRNWLDCIRERKRPVADVEIGARSVTVVHLGNLAYWHGRTLKWDPKNWKFADAEANQWLDGQRRDPWQLPSV